mmetsp:Transcript_17819/g.44464  ORF Transcript_17819/g.44464 Transcript_17819/m.44464 type:complete len:175 (+) Transcript_17819:109-633(+)
MNLFFFSIISSFFLFANGDLNFRTLWNLENPTTIYDQASNKFSLSYVVNENIKDSHVKAKIFTFGCQNPADGSKAIEVSDGITVEKMGASNGKGSLEFTLNIPTLTQNDDVFDATNPERPSIKLCARYMLSTPNGHEVNFIESLLTLKFDMRGTEFSFSGFDSKEFDSSGQAMS